MTHSPAITKLLKTKGNEVIYIKLKQNDTRSTRSIQGSRSIYLNSF